MAKQGNPTIGGQPVILNTVASAVADPARNQALSASLTALIEKNVLGYPTFSTLEAYAAGTTVFHDRRLHTFNVAHAAGAWDGTQVTEANIKDLIPALIKAGLEAGEITPAVAHNLASWDGASTNADYTQTLPVDTTGGDLSIDSDVPARLVSIGAKTDFSASVLWATGFNLLRRARTVGSGYAIMVPAMPYSEIGHATTPNGLLFTDENGVNLRPTVRFKPLSAGAPTSVSDGTECAYTDATQNGKTYRFYNTAQAGWLVISGITLSKTCAHIGWSRRYDDYVAIDDAGDAGSEIALTAVIEACHSFGQLLVVGNASDTIETVSDTQLRWIRNVDRMQPLWSTTATEGTDGTVTYLHTATIAGMKQGGSAAFQNEDQSLTIDGQTVSYSDQNEVALTDYVKYELATAATGTVNIGTTLAVEDWGMIVLQTAVGEAYVSIAYAQGLPDTLRSLAGSLDSHKLQVLVEAIAGLHYEVDALRRTLAEGQAALKAVTFDAENGFMIMGQKMFDIVSEAPTEIPKAVGLVRFNSETGACYLSKAVTNSTGDWALIK
jgi:hypothetical protein